MNREFLESQWSQVKDLIKDKWNKLTDDDIRYINGRFDQLIEKLQQRYGYTRDQAEEEFRKWNFDKRGAHLSKSRDEMGDRDDSSWLKWLLGIGIPLLLLGWWWFGSHKDHVKTPQPKTMVEEVNVMVEKPADATLGQMIRQALMNHQQLFQDLRTLRVTADNGVVTITGSVANAQERQGIINILRNVRGVSQINDQIEVRE